MSTLDKTLFICICMVLFTAGRLSVPFEESVLLNEYEMEIEQLNRDKANLENFIMLGDR